MHPPEHSCRGCGYLGMTQAETTRVLGCAPRTVNGGSTGSSAVASVTYTTRAPMTDVPTYAARRTAIAGTPRTGRRPFLTHSTFSSRSTHVSPRALDTTRWHFRGRG